MNALKSELELRGIGALASSLQESRDMIMYP
jgi:hypothetical protein